MTIQNYKLKSKFILFILLIAFLNLSLLIFNLSLVKAATVTTKAAVGTPSAIPTDEEVKEIREVVQEKVKEKIQEIKDKIEKKGYVGILREMTDSTLTLETLNGEKIVQIATQAAIIDANRKEIKAKELEIDQKIICMGTLDENKILQAKRIVVVPTPTKILPKRQAFTGKIEKIDFKTKIITLTHLKKSTQQYIIKVEKNTKFLQGKFEDLKIGNILVIISSQTKESETPTALLINPLSD